MKELYIEVLEQVREFGDVSISLGMKLEAMGIDVDRLVNTIKARL